MACIRCSCLRSWHPLWLRCPGESTTGRSSRFASKSPYTQAAWMPHFVVMLSLWDSVLTQQVLCSHNPYSVLTPPMYSVFTEPNCTLLSRVIMLLPFSGSINAPFSSILTELEKSAHSPNLIARFGENRAPSSVVTPLKCTGFNTFPCMRKSVPQLLEQVFVDAIASDGRYYSNENMQRALSALTYAQPPPPVSMFSCFYGFFMYTKLKREKYL